MGTSPTDKSVKDEEEEMRTEEIVPAKISDEEDEVRTEQDEVRTEEVDPAKTTEEAEEEVRTEEEDEPKEEANEESDQGTENQHRQEDPITTRSSDQTMHRGSTSVTKSDQNRRLDSDPNASAIRLRSREDEESDQGAENQNPQEEVRRSGGQTIERGSTSSASDQNRRLVPLNPSGAQNSQQMVPHLGPRSFVPPHQQDQQMVPHQNHPFGLPQPRWLVTDHFYSDGLGLYGAQWRYRTISPLLPNQNTYLQHQLVMMELPHQPGPVLVCYTQSLYVLQQDRLVPHVAAPPMRPPTMQQNQFRTLAPPRPMLPMDQLVVYQEQNQIVPNAGQQAPVRPPMMYNQDQIVPSRGQLEAPMWQPPVRMGSPTPIVDAVPLRPMRNYNQQQQFNQGQQRFRFPVNMIQHHLPEQNQQLQPQAQQPWEWESQGSNDGLSSPGESEG